MKLLKAIKNFDTLDKKARFLHYLIECKMDIDWTKLISLYNNILFVKFTDKVKRNPKKYYSSRDKGWKRNIISLIEDKKHVRDIFDYYISKKDYDKIKKILNIRPSLLIEISTEQWKTILPYVFYKRIQIKHFMFLNKSKIKELLKYDITLYIEGRGVNSELMKKGYLYYIKNGGKINTSQWDQAISHGGQCYIEEVLSVIIKDNVYKSILKKMASDYNLYFSRLDMRLENNNRNSVIWKVNCDLVDTINKHFFRKKYRETEVNILEKELFDLELDFSKYFKNKAVIRKLGQICLRDDFIYPASFRAAYFCKKYYENMDEQLLLPLIFNYKETYSEEEFYYIIDNEYLDSFFKVCSKLTSERKAIKWFLKGKINSRDLRDTSEMYDKLIKLKEGNVLIPKFKTLKLLHDWLSIELNKLKQKKFKLGQGLDSLDGLELGEDIVVRIPQTNHDLIAIGKELKHCVGNGGYADRALMDSIKLVTLYKKNQLWSCIEFKEGNFVQKRGLRNSQTKLNEKQEKMLLKAIKNAIDSKKAA